MRSAYRINLKSNLKSKSIDDPDNKYTSPDNYISILQKSLPSEAIATYFLATSLRKDVNNLIYFDNFILILLLFLTATIRFYLSRDSSNSSSSIQWLQVIISTTICFFWLHSLDNYQPFLNYLIADFSVYSKITGFALSLLSPYIIIRYGTGERGHF